MRTIIEYLQSLSEIDMLIILGIAIGTCGGLILYYLYKANVIDPVKQGKSEQDLKNDHRL